MKAKVLKLFIFLGFICSLVLIGVSAFATSSAVSIVDGAEIRTTGNQGLRFIASVDTLDGTDEHGFYLAIGSHSLEDFNSAVSEGSETIGESKLLQVPVEGEDTEFKAVVINIPEEYYTQEISAVSYVREGEVITLSEAAVTRSVAEVAVKAAADGETGDIIDDIFTYLNDNYKNVIIGSSDKAVYVTSPVIVENLKESFIDDVNKTVGTSLTPSMSQKEFFLALSDCPENKYNAAKTGNTDISNNPLFKFFKDEDMNKKWGIFIEYINAVGSGNPHVVNQSKALLNAVTFNGIKDANYQYDFFYLEHMIFSIYNYFNQTNLHIFYTPLKWSNYADNEFDSNIYVDSSKWNLVKVGESIDLATLEKEGYTFDGYKGNELNKDSYVVTVSSEILKPQYSPIEYTITYNDGKNELTELGSAYTIENKVILPELDDVPGLTFAGWYDNEEFEGTAITTISAGSTGDKVYYAKWIEGYSEIVVNSQWSELVNGDTVEFNSVEYTYGSNAHATIGDALSFIQEDGIIYVVAGTYNESVTISVNGVKLVGPNADNSANGSVERVEEAVISDIITLGANSTDVTIKGFKFVDNAQITNATSSANTTADYYVSGFTFVNNYVDKGTSTTKFINFKNGDAYTRNIVIDNSYFTANSIAATEDVITIYNNDNLTVTNSKFENISGSAIAVYDSANASGLRENLTIENNIFKTLAGSALWINYTNFRTTSTYTISIKKNLFEDIDGGACIDFEKCGGRNAAKSFEISENTFKDVWKSVWLVTKTANFTNNKVYLYEGAKSSPYIIKVGTSNATGAAKFGRNLYLSADGSTVSTEVSTSLFINVTGYNDNNYATLDEYEEAIAALEE